MDNGTARVWQVPYGVICQYLIVPEQAQLGEARAVVGAGGEGRKPLQPCRCHSFRFNLRGPGGGGEGEGRREA